MARRAEFSVRLKITTTSCNVNQIIYAILAHFLKTTPLIAKLTNHAARLILLLKEPRINTLPNITSLSPSGLTLLYQQTMKGYLGLYLAIHSNKIIEQNNVHV
jgi:hypothetical protein